MSETESGLVIPGEPVPLKRRGESFEDYWSRCTFEQKARLLFVADAVGHSEPRITWIWYMHAYEEAA
jgi:hypothetical protein